MQHANEIVNRARGRYKKSGEATNGKICPFMSAKNEKVECTEECQLYKQGKDQKYACPLTELNDIAYSLKGN